MCLSKSFFLIYKVCSPVFFISVFFWTCPIRSGGGSRGQTSHSLWLFSAPIPVEEGPILPPFGEQVCQPTVEPRLGPVSISSFGSHVDRWSQRCFWSGFLFLLIFIIRVFNIHCLIFGSLGTFDLGQGYEMEKRLLGRGRD